MSHVLLQACPSRESLTAMSPMLFVCPLHFCTCLPLCTVEVPLEFGRVCKVKLVAFQFVTNLGTSIIVP